MYLLKGELTRVVRETEDVLMNGAKIFTRGDALLHPVNCRAAIVDGKPTKKSKVARLRRYTPESLLLDIEDSAQFKSFVKRGNILEEMPRERAKCKCRARFSTIRRRHSRDVAGIITTPLMAVSMGVDPPESETRNGRSTARAACVIRSATWRASPWGSGRISRRPNIWPPPPRLLAQGTQNEPFD